MEIARTKYCQDTSLTAAKANIRQQLSRRCKEASEGSTDNPFSSKPIQWQYQFGLLEQSMEPGRQFIFESIFVTLQTKTAEASKKRRSCWSKLGSSWRRSQEEAKQKLKFRLKKSRSTRARRSKMRKQDVYSPTINFHDAVIYITDNQSTQSLRIAQEITNLQQANLRIVALETRVTAGQVERQHPLTAKLRLDYTAAIAPNCCFDSGNNGGRSCIHFENYL